MNLSRFKLWIFDLDGTLLDSRRDLAVAVNATLESFAFPTLEEAAVVSFVGDGADDLLRKSFAAAGCPPDRVEARLPEFLAWFLAYYQEHCLDYTRPYPGAEALLERVSALPMAVLTNKPLLPAERILENLGLSRYFQVLVPGDGPHGKKPDPAGLAYILKTLNIAANEAVLVGDSMQDLRTARAAGCAFIAFLGGLGDAGAISAAMPDLSVDRLDQIVKLLDGNA